MDEVVSADGQRVTVSHGHKDRELGTGELHPRGEGKGAPVERMQRMEVRIALRCVKSSQCQRP